MLLIITDVAKPYNQQERSTYTVYKYAESWHTEKASCDIQLVPEWIFKVYFHDD